MTDLTALVLPPRRPEFDRTSICGLPLVERAVLALHRAGIDRIVVSSERLDDAGLPGRLAARGIGITIAPEDVLPAVPAHHAALIVSADVVFEPKVIARMVASADRDGTCALGAITVLGGVLAYLPAPALDELRRCGSVSRGLFQLYRTGALVRVDVAPLFCRPVPLGGRVGRLERDYIRRGNGTEGFFGRTVRHVSVPVSQLLLRLGVSANEVTMLGLALAGLAALQFTHRAFWPSVIGALFYCAGVVMDCSDGEVARASVSDSTSRAWLETITDYASHFLVLGGLVVGELRFHGICLHVEAAAVAAVASLAVVGLVGWLRHEVAETNPGAFDAAVWATLSQGTRLERLAASALTLMQRSFMAHLVLFLALIGQLPALLYLWMCGSVVALTTVLAVKGSLVRRVKVEPVREVVRITRRGI